MTVRKKLISIDNDDAGENILQMIREVAGDEVADELIDRFGGARLQLPSMRTFRRGKSALARMVGTKLAEQIMEACGTGQGDSAYVPIGNNSVVKRASDRVEELLQQDGLSANDVALLTGVHMRTVYRRRADMLKRGMKIGRFDAPRPSPNVYESVKGANIVRQLLLEGHSPSLLRDIMSIPASVILTIRAELLKQGKLN